MSETLIQQHVLEPLFVYLMIAQKQYEDINYEGYYNVGPDECDCVTTGELVSIFCEKFSGGINWKDVSEENAPHEASYLKLDCSKLKKTFGWAPVWSIDKTVEKVVEWTKVYFAKGNIPEIMDKQILEFIADSEKTQA